MMLIQTKIVANLLEEIQERLFTKAIDYRDSHTTVVDDFDAFKDAIENKGGFISAHWDGTEETEDKIKELDQSNYQMYSYGCKM